MKREKTKIELYIEVIAANDFQKECSKEILLAVGKAVTLHVSQRHKKNKALYVLEII